jgi:chromosome segregation ATPase
MSVPAKQVLNHILASLHLEHGLRRRRQFELLAQIEAVTPKIQTLEEQRSALQGEMDEVEETVDAYVERIALIEAEIEALDP